MPNPEYPVICLKNTWTKVATAVFTGQIHRDKKGPSYFHTYRITGDPAPTDIAEGQPAFVDSNSLEISAIEDIDVYIYAKGRKDGSVRVDV